MYQWRTCARGEIRHAAADRAEPKLHLEVYIAVFLRKQGSRDEQKLFRCGFGFVDRSELLPLRRAGVRTRCPH